MAAPVHPSPLQVAVQTEHTKGNWVYSQTRMYATINCLFGCMLHLGMSWLIRTGLSIERKWYDLTADKGPVAIGALVALGVVCTFFLVFVPLFFLFGTFSPLVPGVKKKKRKSLEQHQDFLLSEGEWIDQMKQWVESANNLTDATAIRRYRCCLFTENSSQLSSDYPEGFARCFPFPANIKYMYPWNNPCPKAMQYKDVEI